MSDAAPPVLEIRNLVRSFPQANGVLEVFKGANATVRRGEIVTLIGPSGAGKSSLLHIAGLLEPPTSGEVLIEGRSAASLSDAERTSIRRTTLGFVYQFHHLLPEFTALENVMMPVLLAGLPTQEATTRAQTLLESVGLGHRLAHKPGELSGGERQRAAVARALVNMPACVLGDEPTGNLDEKTAATVFAQMLELNRVQATSLVLVTHDRRLARKLDRVLELREGRLHALAASEV